MPAADTQNWQASRATAKDIIDALGEGTDLYQISQCLNRERSVLLNLDSTFQIELLFAEKYADIALRDLLRLRIIDALPTDKKPVSLQQVALGPRGIAVAFGIIAAFGVGLGAVVFSCSRLVSCGLVVVVATVVVAIVVVSGRRSCRRCCCRNLVCGGGHRRGMFGLGSLDGGEIGGRARRGGSWRLASDVLRLGVCACRGGQRPLRT